MPTNDDYSTLLDLFIRLVQSQAGQRIEPGEQWLDDAQTLSIKLFRHLVSMQTLAAGATVEQDGVPTVFFIDHASTKVIARATLETYLVFFYLYGCADRSLSEFRHKTWRLGGLVDRQGLHTSTADHRAILIAEKQKLDPLRSEIEASPHIQVYTKKQRVKLLGGDWRIGKSWADLGANAGLHPKYFSDVYGYLCGYSHASYASAMQVGQAKSIEDQRMLAQPILGFGVVIMAHFAFTYSNVFSSAGVVLSASPDAKRVADKWRFGADDMATIYDSQSLAER